MFSQKDIKGEVIDEKGHPLEYVNVLLLTADSTYINTTFSNEKGSFTFSNIKDKDYLIKLTCLGYEDNIFPITSGNLTLTVKMKPSSITLNEITVSSKKKTFIVKNGSLIVDVQNTILKSLGNGIDIISRLPGVINDNEDNLTVIGKGSPQIFIDGRQVIDNTELRRLNSNDIASVEYVGTPGAQYDGETKAIIKVKTIRKQKEEGFSSRLQGVESQGEKFSRNEALDLTYKVKKLDIRLSLYDYNSSKKSNGDYYTIMNSDTIWKIQEKSNGYSRYKYDNISSTIYYEFNSLHNLNLLYNFTNSNPIMENDNWMNVIANDEKFTDLKYNSSLIDKNNDHRLNLSYLGQIQKMSLDINLDYFTKNYKQNQTNNEFSDIGERVVETSAKTVFDIYAGKVKMNYRLAPSTFINAGVDLSYTQRKGTFYNKQNIIPNTNTSITESRNGYFIDFSSKINKITLSTGIRYEYQSSKQKDYSTGISQILHNKDYHTFLPSFNLLYPISNVQLSFSASKRIKRPTYYQLRDGTQYNGRFEYDKGNPYLLQEKITTFAITGAWKNLYLNVGYNKSSDFIGTFFYQDEQNTSLKVATPINYDHKSDFSIDINYSPKIGFWTPQISTTCIFPHFKLKYLEKEIHLTKIYAFLQLYNSFTTNNNYIFGLDIVGNTAGNIGETYFYKQFYTNISVRKSFLNNSLDVSFKINDIFKSAKRKSSNKIGTVYYSRDQYNDTRLVSLSITYKFNNFRTKKRIPMAGDEEINRTY